MFGRSRLCITITGLVRARDFVMRVMVAGGAEAVRAMNGALDRDLRPPI